MKIKVISAFKLTEPLKTIFDIEILDEEKLVKGKKFINIENNLEFIIASVGHVNPPFSKYYPLIVNINNNTKLSDFKSKIFIIES